MPDHDPEYPPGPLLRVAAWAVMTFARLALVGWRIRWRVGL